MRGIRLGSACLAALLCAVQAPAFYLSTTSRPAAQNDPAGPQCRSNRRTIFDTGGTLTFTTSDTLTADETLALQSALKAWTDVTGSSIKLEFRNTGQDNASQIVGAQVAGTCPTTYSCDLLTNDVDFVDFNYAQNDAFCDPAATYSETLLAQPGFQPTWNQHTFCGTQHWTIAGSRIRIRAGLSAPALAQTLAHEIGVALGFAETNQPSVLNPSFDVNNPPYASSSPPYTVTLQAYDIAAARAIYPEWIITAPANVCGESQGNAASVLNPEAVGYLWESQDATITSGQGTSSITFSAPAFRPIFCFVPPCPRQTMRLSVTALKSCYDGGQPSPVTGSVDVEVIGASYDLSPFSRHFTSAGGAGSIQVTTGSTCAWSVSGADGSFVSITSGGSGMGNGVVTYSVSANATSSARSVTLGINGRSFEVTQSAAGAASPALVSNATAGQVALSWTGVGAAEYQVSRATGGNGFSPIATTSNLFYNDTSVTNGTGYLYRVAAVTSGVTKSYSNIDVAVPYAYTDPTITARSTKVKAAHVNEIGTVINAARYAFGWQGYPFLGVGPGQGILRSHVIELRSAVDAVLAGAGSVGAAYTTITAGSTPIAAAHIIELRNALR